ncbi:MULTISPECIES: LysE family transporter [unclassified Microbacterium]|uniref:LysE family transporter n=1 Tax=unclassified Microbacterium TaxID=2609290 RepID=UPI0031387CFC
MSVALWVSLLTACIVISFTPGAGAINTMSNSLSQGWRRSIWGIIGQQIALIIHVVIVAAGVGLIVSRSEILFNVIRYAGAAYLVYLGIRLILTKPTIASEDEAALAEVPREGRWSMIRRGLWVNLLNPKAIVFFLAFIPQFVRLDQPQLPQYLTIITTSIVVDVIVMWGFFAAAARPFRRLTRSARGQRVLNTVFGVLFIAVAALLVLLH